MRGKVGSIAVFYIRCGITPACAGKSRSIAESVLAFRDHPRVCGEKRTSGSGSQRSEGSPPRVRGKETQTAIRVIAGGITPACAGKSFSAVRWQPSHGDHPRVCGEKCGQPLRFCRFSGSPPRVRGKVCERLAPLGQWGITPACAGKSQGGSVSQGGGQDHPRVCGEKTTPKYPVMDDAGSPPRVRGKAEFRRGCPAAPGITPACAGKRGSECRELP